SGHPYIETIERYLAANKATHDKSPLQHFDQLWRPQNAAEALGLFHADISACLATAPPHGVLFPWASSCLQEAIRHWARLCEQENLSYGLVAGLEEGLLGFSPLSPGKIDIEYKRLTTVTDSIRQLGYL